MARAHTTVPIVLKTTTMPIAPASSVRAVKPKVATPKVATPKAPPKPKADPKPKAAKAPARGSAKPKPPPKRTDAPKPKKAKPKASKRTSTGPTRAEVERARRQTQAIIFEPTSRALRGGSSSSVRVAPHYAGPAGLAAGGIALGFCAWWLLQRKPAHAAELQPPKEALIGPPAPAPVPTLPTLPRMTIPKVDFDKPEFKKPVTGILLAAAREQALDPIVWVWVPVPGADLEIEVPCDAFRATLAGVEHMRIGATYGELREIAKLLGCVPPSKEMVDAIYGAASVHPKAKRMVQTKLDADRMNTVGMELQYNAHLEQELAAAAKAKGLDALPANTLIEPVGKWWILHPNLAVAKSKEHSACTYGWFDGSVTAPIQGPSQDAHNDEHCDYSQLGRAIHRKARKASDKSDVDLCDWYVAKWPQLKPFVDVYR